MTKKRLDLILVERGLATSRTAAAAMIMAGEVSAAGRSLTKPGQLAEDAIDLQVKQRPRYVSRGGDKLASVAAQLDLVFAERVVVDVGASTGGFTDFALQHGAAKVYAVDVGHGQLDWRLRQDPRVVVVEDMDVRRLGGLPPQEITFSPRPQMAMIDVAFISLTKVLGPVASLITPGGPIIAMAKPQFEAGKVLADRYKGVIKDETARQAILAQLEASISDRFKVLGKADSAVLGPKGNKERFYLLAPR